MNDDLSDLMKNFSNNNIDINKVKNLLNTLSSSDKSSTDLNNNIDINTFLKIKDVMDKINSTNNDKRSNLLMALKPFLRESRQEKLDQYMKLLNIAPIIEMLNNDNGGDNNGNKVH